MSHAEDEATTAPAIVWSRGDELFELAQSLLGARLAELRRDPDGGVRVTVIDLADDDRATLESVASRIGIAEWTRIERADPADLSRWESLRQELVVLSDQIPSVLQGYPSPESEYQRSPVSIQLYATARAQAVAANLHNRYGDYVSLRVGALPYPPSSDGPPIAESRRERVDPAELSIRLTDSAPIRSGESETRELALVNHSDRPIVANTDGSVAATVIDPVTGAPIGQFSGWTHQLLITFTADPGQTVRIPVLIGTASLQSDLGYAVPAGEWHLAVELNLADGRRLVSAPMPITIID